MHFSHVMLRYRAIPKRKHLTRSRAKHAFHENWFLPLLSFCLCRSFVSATTDLTAVFYHRSSPKSTFLQCHLEKQINIIDHSSCPLPLLVEAVLHETRPPRLLVRTDRNQLGPLSQMQMGHKPLLVHRGGYKTKILCHHLRP